MGCDVKLALEIEAGAETVFDAITTQEGEAAFWTSDNETEPKEGSVAVFRFPGAPVPAPDAGGRAAAGAARPVVLPRRLPRLAGHGGLVGPPGERGEDPPHVQAHGLQGGLSRARPRLDHVGLGDGPRPPEGLC